VCLLAIYVDDVLIVDKDKPINKIKNEIKENFELSDIGPVDLIVDIKFITCDNEYIIHQYQYINNIFRNILTSINFMKLIIWYS